MKTLLAIIFALFLAGCAATSMREANVIVQRVHMAMNDAIAKGDRQAVVAVQQDFRQGLKNIIGESAYLDRYADLWGGLATVYIDYNSRLKIDQQNAVTVRRMLDSAIDAVAAKADGENGDRVFAGLKNPEIREAFVLWLRKDIDPKVGALTPDNMAIFWLAYNDRDLLKSAKAAAETVVIKAAELPIQTTQMFDRAYYERKRGEIMTEMTGLQPFLRSQFERAQNEENQRIQNAAAFANTLGAVILGIGAGVLAADAASRAAAPAPTFQTPAYQPPVNCVIVPAMRSTVTGQPYIGTYDQIRCQ